MKRIVSLSLAVLMLAALFVACSSNSVEGTYKLTKINDKNVKEYFDDLASLTGMSLEVLGLNTENLDNMMVITLNSDKTAEMKSSMEGEEEVATGTWEQNGDKISITADGSTTEFTLANGELTLDMGDGEMKMKMVLTKK